MQDLIDVSVEEAFETENITTSEMENSKMKALYELTRLECHGFSDDDESISDA
jgi:nitrate/TMAO reductase-like tetraheme cytochrome c subunit